MKFWDFVKLSDMYYHDEGYFLLKFKSFKDMDKVLMKGPCTIHNLPMILRE